jgi:hypothetical protein
MASKFPDICLSAAWFVWKWGRGSISWFAGNRHSLIAGRVELAFPLTRDSEMHASLCETERPVGREADFDGWVANRDSEMADRCRPGGWTRRRLHVRGIRNGAHGASMRKRCFATVSLYADRARSAASASMDCVDSARGGPKGGHEAPGGDVALLPSGGPAGAPKRTESSPQEGGDGPKCERDGGDPADGRGSERREGRNVGRAVNVPRFFIRVTVQPPS